MKSKIITSTLLGIGFLIGATALSALADWTGAPLAGPTNCPTDLAPNDAGYIEGCFAPINVGSKLQNKLGTLGTLGLSILGDFKFLPVGGAQPTAGQVLTADSSDLANGKVKWATPASGGSSGTITVIQKFSTRYSILMADSVFRTWVNNSLMPTNGSDDHGWYIRSADQKFTDTKNRLCTFFVENGRSYGSYTGADYGSDNNNVAYYWSPANSSWVAENHGDNGAIDITSLICVGSGVYERGLPYLL